VEEEKALLPSNSGQGIAGCLPDESRNIGIWKDLVNELFPTGTNGTFVCIDI
jgi:hypothetical protein